MAVYFDKEETLAWWHRNVARVQYGLQGWRRGRIDPDFIFAAGGTAENRRIIVLEMKGDHLEGNIDSAYKRDLLACRRASGRSSRPSAIRPIPSTRNCSTNMAARSIRRTSRRTQSGSSSTASPEPASGSDSRCQLHRTLTEHRKLPPQNIVARMHAGPPCLPDQLHITPALGCRHPRERALRTACEDRRRAVSALCQNWNRLPFAAGTQPPISTRDRNRLEGHLQWV